MKNILSILAIALCALCTWGTEAAKTPIFSSTIDFLDYAFAQSDPVKEYFTLERYEEAIRSMAQGGIKKLYLRVNVCGGTLYPTEVSAQYGYGNAYHWNLPKESRHLINTFAHYNPCLETIRLGHKYGMEVWAWESLYDDAGISFEKNMLPSESEEAFRKLYGWALLDPFYVDNPDALAMRDPLATQEGRAEAVEINKKALEKPVARILFTNDPLFNNRPTPRIRSSKDLIILVSNDNEDYQPYEGSYTVTPSVTADGLNQLDITGLAIRAKYVKLAVQEMPLDNNYTIVLTRERGQCHIYDADGEEIYSVWGFSTTLNHTGLPLRFTFGVPTDRSRSIALDYASRAVGFSVGVPEEGFLDKYYLGVAEFAVPKAMEHKVQRFVEVARYPFDGFMFNTRCHSACGNPQEYGYNPEVLAEFQRRNGRPYAGTAEDIAGVFQIRGEAIAEFFRRCKAESNGRPIYLSANMPLEMKDDPDYNDSFGPMPWLYKQYFADGSIDGVMMSGRNFRNGRDFSEYFTSEITGGKEIKIGLFREMGCNCPKNYDFEADMKPIVENGRLDEVELYESVDITSHRGPNGVYQFIRQLQGE